MAVHSAVNFSGKTLNVYKIVTTNPNYGNREVIGVLEPRELYWADDTWNNISPNDPACYGVRFRKAGTPGDTLGFIVPSESNATNWDRNIMLDPYNSITAWSYEDNAYKNYKTFIVRMDHDILQADSSSAWGSVKSGQQIAIKTDDPDAGYHYKYSYTKLKIHYVQSSTGSWKAISKAFGDQNEYGWMRVNLMHSMPINCDYYGTW